MTPKERVIRNHINKGMIVRELALMGYYRAQIARICRTSKAQVTMLSRAFDIEIVAHPPKFSSPLCMAIRAGYAAEKRPAEIAAEIGTTPGAVKVLASKMKVTTRDPCRYQRGFVIPADRRREYREITRLGCTPIEAGWSMGLLPRPTVQAHGAGA